MATNRPPRIPKQLHIGALTYQVTQDRTAWLEACRTEGAEVAGSTDHTKALIVIDKNQAPCQQRDTLLHELIHCLTDTTGLASELGTEWDERLARRLAPALLDVLRRNPRLYAYLTA